jgi:hypothetical protein
MSTDCVRVISKQRALRGGRGVLWSAVFVLHKRTELIDYTTLQVTVPSIYTSDNCTDNMAKQCAVNETQHSRPSTRWITSFMKTALCILRSVDYAYQYNSCKWPTWRTILFSVCLFQFSTCFKQLRAHHLENQSYQYNTWYVSLWKQVNGPKLQKAYLKMHYL